jgi:hypothetical protein
MGGIGFNPAFVPAQEKQEAQDLSVYTFGVVKQVSAERIVISEYDYTADKEVDVEYIINGGTQFINVSSAGDIQPGDEVEIVFVDEQGKKTAQSVSLDEEMAEQR